MPPEITVLDGTTIIVSGQTTPIHLGSVVYGEAAPSKTFTIRNDGDETLTLPTPFANLSHFTISQPTTTTLGAGETTTFTVTLDTSTIWSGSEELFVASNDADNGDGIETPFTFLVSGMVNAALLTITAADRSKTYGQGVTFAGVEFTTAGLVNGDTVSGVTLASSGAAATAGVLGSPYAIVPSAAVGTGLGNYTISYVAGELTVTPAALTITADSKTKVYGAALPTLTASYEGLVNGDAPADLDAGPTLVSTATAGSGVSGSPYAITASGASDANYTISYVAGELTVTPAALTITIEDKTKLFGQTFTAFTGIIAGIQNNDDIAASYSSDGAAADAAVGQYPIAATLIDPDGKLGNYAVTIHPGALTVAPAPTVAISGPGDGYRGMPGQQRTFTFSASEPSGPGGPFTFQVLWGDGTAVESVSGPAVIQVAHAFASADSYTITATATDREGATGPSSAGLGVEIVVVEQQGLNVLIGGTTTSNEFTLIPAAGSGVLSVQVDGTSYGTFTVDPSGCAQILGQTGGDAVTINGTGGPDAFVFTTSGLTLNGTAIEGSGISFWSFDGKGGKDSATLQGSDDADQAELGPKAASLTAGGVTVNVSGTPTITVDGRGGSNAAVFHDSPAAIDLFTAKLASSTQPATATQYDSPKTYSLTALGFNTVQANGSGIDIANLYDSPANDTFTAKPNSASLTDKAGSYAFAASGYYYVFAHADRGYDMAFLSDPQDNLGDQYTSRPNFGLLTRPGKYSNTADGFDSIFVTASGGYDTAILTGSDKADTFLGQPTTSTLYGAGYYQRVRAFDQVIAEGGLGNDRAYLYDTSGTDHFRGTWAESRMWGSGYTVRARGFKMVNAYASLGTDDATLIGAAGDVQEVGPNWAEIRDPARTRWIRAVAFDPPVTVNIPSSSSIAKKAKPGLLPVDLLLASEGQW